MDIAARLVVPVVVALTGLVGFYSSTPDEAENLRRLQAMPRERRVALSENLERFDKLGPLEQAEIRRIDDEIARLDPTDQARSREVLRRYNLWLNGLAPDQKQKLADAGSDEARFNLATQIRRAEKDRKPYPGPRFVRIRIGDLGLIGPFEAAYLLKVWQKLPEQARADLSKRSGSQLHDEIRNQGRALRIPMDRFPAAEEAHYDTLLDKDPDFKTQLGPLANRQALKKAADRLLDPSKKAEAIQKRFQHPYAEFLYFEEHPPIPVTPERLAQFTASCPPWLLVTIDPLSADDARNYLTILYRQLYPEPKEIAPPADPKAKPGSAAGPARPAAPPKKSQPPPP